MCNKNKFVDKFQINKTFDRKPILVVNNQYKFLTNIY